MNSLTSRSRLVMILGTATVIGLVLTLGFGLIVGAVLLGLQVGRALLLVAAPLLVGTLPQAAQELLVVVGVRRHGSGRRRSR